MATATKETEVAITLVLSETEAKLIKALTLNCLVGDPTNEHIEAL